MRILLDALKPKGISNYLNLIVQRAKIEGFVVCVSALSALAMFFVVELYHSLAEPTIVRDFPRP
jgi:hypothetical protein